MNIFDLEYQFYKNIRTVRRSYFQRRFRRSAQTSPLPLVLRVGAFIFLGLLLVPALQVSSDISSVQEEDKVVEVLSQEGDVLAIEIEEAPSEPLLLENPRRIPDSPEAPDVSATSVYLIDTNTGDVLYQKNGEDQVSIASITKVMTVLVALNNYDLDDSIVIPAECLGLEGNQVGLVTGEEWTVEELLYAMLLLSASDASCAIASHYTSVPDFVAAMNLQAAQLGLDSTRIENPIGLDAADHYSSARDVVALGANMMEKDVFRRIVGTTEITLHERIIPTTNELLGTLRGLNGIKTGTTDAAGECFLFSVERAEGNITGAVLGSSERFAETEALVEWAYGVHRWE